MRYSQPYGTPDPPLGTYPRYINGDPVTGTEGSIPPNTAIDEAQIEILTVISRAKSGDSTYDFPPNPSFPDPDHADLTQLWQAIMSIVATQYITTHIYKTVHGAGADFVDLNEGLNWLSNYVITPTGFVTFQIQPGKWTYTQTVEINHPNSNRIEIVGPAFAITITPGNGPNQIPVTGYSAGAQTTDSANQINSLRSSYLAELSFTGGINGFVIMRGGCTLRWLLITGSGTTLTGNIGQLVDSGIGLFAMAACFIDGMAWWGWGNSGIWIQNSEVRVMSMLSTVVCNAKWVGIYSEGGQFRSLGNNTGSIGSWTIVATCGVCGIIAYGTRVWCWKLNVRGVLYQGGVGAVTIEEGSQLSCFPGSTIGTNGNIGVWVAGASTWMGEGVNYTGNGVVQFHMDGGKAWVDDSVFSGGTWAITITGGANCEALRTGAISGLTQPAVNADGSANSYILWSVS